VQPVCRLPKGGDKATKRGKFAATAIGFVHIDSFEPLLAEGKIRMLLDDLAVFRHVKISDALYQAASDVIEAIDSRASDRGA
jgi:hypothetical protein